MSGIADDRLLGHGIYDLDEIARLVRRSSAEVSTWTTGGQALLSPRKGRLFGFYDLVTAVVTAELRRRQVPLVRVQDARKWLADDVLPDVQWPLAHAVGLKALASVGRNVYFHHPQEGWLDASSGGQRPFVAVVSPLIRHLTFDELGMASEWRPVRGIVVDPDVQAGAPCLDGTRIPTTLIAELVEAGEDPEDIAQDYALDIRLVKTAMGYETQLTAA